MANMEKRLVDMKKLIDHCFDTIREFQKQGEDIVADAIRKNILWYLVDVESIDAVPVVRCKDCIKISPSVTEIKNAVWCRTFRAYMPCDGFCSYGERKDGDGNG